MSANRPRHLFGVELTSPKVAGVGVVRGLWLLAVFALQRVVMRGLERLGRGAL